MTDTGPSLVFAGLGAFHGLNPAMGWLFAVALGLHRQSRSAVMVSLLPIAAGHMASIAVVTLLLVAAGTMVSAQVVRTGTGVLLLAWAAYHWQFGHRHRVRFGMQVGLLGLAAWSFLMSTAHGAGLMLWPALMASCTPASAVAGTDLAGPVAATLLGVGVHTIAMLATTAIIAALVYEWLGLAVLRKAWLNVDALWVAGLAVTGALLLTGTL